MKLLWGLLAGLAFYCATAFPFALTVAPTGEAWSGVYMLYGVMCGAVGTSLVAD